MQRIKLLIEYNGAPYAGWQRQPDIMTVQQVLEDAATALNGSPVVVRGAGRTDAGVHATGQVADMDLTVHREVRKIADAMNFHMRPHPVAVLAAEEVHAEFSSRFDAIRRAYRYVIINRRAHLTVEDGLAWRMPYEMDAAKMHEAAQVLLGVHDYTTFRDMMCQAKSPVRSLDMINVARYGERIEVTVEARSFLHRQVRSIVGSLCDIGRGRHEAGWMKEILEARDRTACGQVAPAEGLYLERVDYPPE